MDFFQLLSDLDKADPEFMDRINPRRRVFKYLGNTGKKITAAAAPAILASFFTKAYGQTTALPQPVQDVLTLALGLEYLEYHFYNTALGINGLIPSTEVTAVTTIRNDEAGHINTLRNIPGYTPPFSDPTPAAFDYSGGSGSMNGPMKAALIPGGVNTNGMYFFGAAQAFSDTGQRAYKGGAPVLNTNATKDILEAALNIHSVEARHNSHFRTVRRAIAANTLGSATAPVGALDLAPKSWISLRDLNGPPAPDGSHPAAAVYDHGNPASGTVTPSAGADMVYPAEDNTTQASVNLLTGIGTTPYTAAQVSEAFDEPLDAATVKMIARMFTSQVGITLGLFK
jgi:hypothetical protein